MFAQGVTLNLTSEDVNKYIYIMYSAGYSMDYLTTGSTFSVPQASEVVDV